MRGNPGEPPDVSPLSHGYKYLTEQRHDQMEPVLEVLLCLAIAIMDPLSASDSEQR
jgi:glutamine synthetase